MMQSTTTFRYTSRLLYFAFGMWLITFEGNTRLTCYCGNIGQNTDSDRIKQFLHKRGIRAFQTYTGNQDIHCYEFHHNDLDLISEIAANLKPILQQEIAAC